MSFQKPIIDTIRKRRSVRTYDTRLISEADYQKIHSYLSKAENLTGPMGSKIRLELVPVAAAGEDKGIKLGTYGVISNPKAYVVGIVENNPQSLMEFGYVLEQFVLYMTELNIGTCWLGGTFTRKTFEKELEYADNEIIPCITPLGYIKDKQRLIERTMRMVAGSNNRKPWEELFYKGNFKTPVKKEASGNLKTPLEMIRLAPSASNKQPWRVVLSPNHGSCHIYLASTPGYVGNKMGFEMQRVDIGIAMSHLELSCKELKMKGTWVQEDPKLELPDEHTKYVITWKLT